VLIEFVLTPDVHRLRREVRTTGRKDRRRGYRACAVLVLFGLMPLIANEDTPSAQFFRLTGAICGTMGFLLPVVFVLSQRKMARRLVARNPDGVRVRLADTEATFAGAYVTTVFTWDGVESIERRNGFWIAYRGRERLFTIDTGCMGPGQEMAFRIFLVGRGLATQEYRL
jgi:hypothetical protein